MKTPRILVGLSLAAALLCPAGELVVPEEPIALPEIPFPTFLLHRGFTSGEVRLMLKIGPDGSLQDTLVTAYTHKAFADAALAVLPRGTYRAQQVDGRSVTTLVPLVVRFEVNGLLVVQRYASDETELEPGRFAYEPCDPARLDRPLRPTAAPSPGYPNELRQRGVQGQVTVEYYIDEAGRVRMPEVTQAENDLLAGLSLAALEQWQFTPPSSRGRPVLVRVRQSFVFASEKTG